MVKKNINECYAKQASEDLFSNTLDLDSLYGHIPMDDFSLLLDDSN